MYRVARWERYRVLTLRVNMCDAWKRTRQFQKHYVSVKTTHENLQGYIHVIDPETGTIILLAASGAIHIVVAASVKSVSHNKEEAAGDISGSLARLQRRDNFTVKRIDRNVVVERLRARRIEAQVVKDGSGGSQISVFNGIAWIVEPYGPSCVKCTNESVLVRIRQILEQIVADDDGIETKLVK